MKREGIHVEAGYRTASGNTMIIEVNGHLMPRDAVPVVYAEDYVQLCGNCKGLNGGCSLFAPYFDLIKPSMELFYVVDVRIDMAWAIKYAHRHGSSVISHNYFRCGYADLLTDRYLYGMIMKMEEKTGCYALGVGHCHGCSKKDCTVLRDEACAKPKKRHYSIEATGVECSSLNQLLYGSRLPWWFKGTALPAEMRRYAGLFSNENLDYLLLDVIRERKSYIPLDEVSPMPVYDMDLVDAPADSMDAGVRFPMYTDFEEIS